jgi:hypothetical protein
VCRMSCKGSPGTATTAASLPGSGLVDGQTVEQDYWLASARILPSRRFPLLDVTNEAPR